MSKVFEEIANLKAQKLSSDMGPSFIATVLSATKTTREDGKERLKLELQDKDGATFSTTYNIPKALTGKGQMDVLIQQCGKLNLHLADMIGKTFEWRVIKLPGAMTGFDRHYPTKLIEQKKLKP